MSRILLILIFIMSFSLTENVLAASSDVAVGNTVNVALPEFSPELLKIILIITLLGVAPSLLMMVTSFTRIVVVFSILRNAMGLQQSPPNVVIISLSLFLTLFVMNPTFQEAYDDGFNPWVAGEITESQAIELISAPFHKFMLKHAERDDLAMFIDLAKIKDIAAPEDTPYRVLIPAFMISELRKAFELGFLLFLPFLVIDLLVASVLMTMGMMMMPPVVVALPFKIIFFVLIDGWRVISEATVKGFEMASIA